MTTALNTSSTALNLEYIRRYPDEISDWLNQLPLEKTKELLQQLRIPVLSSLMGHLPPALANDIFRDLSQKQAIKLLEHVEPTRAALLLRQLGEKQREELISQIKEDIAHELKRLMKYPPGSAATIMDTHPAALHHDLTVAAALERLRAKKWNVTRSVYVIDAVGKLLGQVAIQDLALSNPQQRLLDLYQPVTRAASEVTSREEISELLEHYKLLELPVLGTKQHLVGVIHYQSLISTIQATVSADIQTMVGVSQDERALSSISFSVRKRLPWLQINLATAFLAASVVGLFEHVIAQVTALAILLPIVAGQSGNTGAQALAVTMRGLALHEISIRHWWRLLRKEVSAGFINGIAIALTTGLAIILWFDSYSLAAVIFISMILAMVAACFSGTLIPIILTRLGQDPAQSSSIILTTVTDVVGFFTFLGTATIFMPYL